MLERVGMDIVRQVNVVHVGQEILHIDFVPGLESAQGGAVLAKIFLAQARHILGGDVHAFDHVLAHARLERGP